MPERSFAMEEEEGVGVVVEPVGGAGVDSLSDLSADVGEVV